MAVVNTRIFSNAAQAILRSSHAELYRAPNSSQFCGSTSTCPSCEAGREQAVFTVL